MSALQAFTDTLNEIKAVRSGISGSRIKKLTQIAVDNENISSQIVDKCYQNVKDTANTHKLGALYVIDSIARRYQDSASSRGQTVGPVALEGTYAHALNKFDNVIQDCLRLTISAASPEQKEKINKLIDIWRKSGTFTDYKLSAIKSEFFGGSTTPQSAPPPLASATSTYSSSSAASSQPAMSADQLLKSLASFQGAPQAPTSQGLNFPPVAPPTQSAAAPVIPGVADPQAALTSLISQMASSGQLPPWLPPNAGVAPPPVAPSPPMGGDSRPRFRGATGLSQEEAFRRAGGESGGRERGSGYSRRPRSRSPQRRHDGPPPGHVIGEKNIPGTAHYRERNVQLDPNLPHNSIKVLSRTMFVGGIPSYMSQDEVKAVLRPYAEVQSVILNPERKHAFVKTYSRREAENVLQNFMKITSVNLRVRWGVGFGPRDCCDYQHGVSIIPIDRLTDADKRWVHSGEWGGIGFERELAPGLVMEEPDIEIGEGVSSKAISKKMPTDATRNGPRSSKPGEADPAANGEVALPAFMRNNNTENPLANLFNNGGMGGVAPPPPQAAAASAPAPGGDALAKLMDMLKNQQG